MNDSQSSYEDAEAERFDKKFASKGWACLLFAPGVLALATAVFTMAIGTEGPITNMLIFMGIFLNLVSVFLDGFRRKIIRQDETIRRLQKELNERSQQGDAGQPATRSESQ